MYRFGRIRLVIVLLLGIVVHASSEGSEPSAVELFNQRIMPIFRSPQPSSCVQCHAEQTSQDSCLTCHNYPVR